MYHSGKFYTLTIYFLEVWPSPENTSTLNQQRWSSTFINIVSTLIFGWKWKLSQRTFIDVVSTLAKESWNNVDRVTSIQRRWTNVISTLKFGWKWKLSWRMFVDVVSTLTKQRWNNIDRITSIQSRWPNVVSTLIVKWKWNSSQHMFISVASTLRKQHLNNLITLIILMFTRKWLKNKAKLNFQV